MPKLQIPSQTLLFLHPLPPSGLLRLPIILMVTALWYNNHHCYTFSHLLTGHWFAKEHSLIPRKAAALRCCDKGPCQELLENLRTPHTATPKSRCLSLKIPQVQLLQKTCWLLHIHIKSSANSFWSVLFFWQCCTIQSQISICCPPSSMNSLASWHHISPICFLIGVRRF